MAREGFSKMYRFALALAVASVVAPVAARAQSESGSIMIPTFASPTIGRLLFSQAQQNGITAYVFRLTDTSGPFTLRTVSGATGLEDFDIQFYSSIEGLAGVTAGDTLCADSAQVCTQTIPSGARWAVVLLSVGFSGSFAYTS